MRSFLSILAADDFNFYKLLVPAIVIASWIIGAIAQSAKKKKPGQTDKPWEEILRDLAGGQQPQHPPIPPAPPPMPPPLPQPTQRLPQQTAPQPRRTAPVPAPRPRPKAQPKPPAVRRAPKRMAPAQPPPVPHAPAILVEVSPQASVFTHTDITATEIGSRGAAKPRGISATAPAIAKWLKPATLRQQWILTEVLGPPVGLRNAAVENQCSF